MELSNLMILLAAAGIFALAGIIIQMKSVARVKSCKIKTTGAVVGIEEKISYDSDGNRQGNTRETTYYHPVYQYEAGGRTITSTSATGTAGSAKFTIGQSVTVFYDENNAEKYYIAEDKAASWFGIVLAVSALLAAAIGTTVYLLQ